MRVLVVGAGISGCGVALELGRRGHDIEVIERAPGRRDEGYMLRETLTVPPAQTTSCAFAGAGLHQLFVTTATESWSDAQRRADPPRGSSTGSRPARPVAPQHRSSGDAQDAGDGFADDHRWKHCQ
jgi:2-polyprenyl-6-methoxyphenol hydroxylase-like FAD-dependent oxidoreductase